MASGALVVQFRDWLGAWLQTHIDLADPDNLLAGDLNLATNVPDPNDTLTRIHKRVGEFVSLQQGVVGQIVGQKVVEAKLGGFLESGGIDALPVASRQSLFPAVGTTSSTVGALGVQALGALEQARQDVKAQVDQLDQQIAAVPALIEAAPAIVALQSAVDTKIDVADLKEELGKADDFHSFVTSFNTFIPRTRVIIPPIVRPGP